LLDEWEARCAAHIAMQTGDAAHDVEHVRRVVANAKRLARAEGAPLDVVVPAAWLHDFVHVAKDSPDRARASALAADEAIRLLGAWGHPPLLLPEIAHAIEAHSFSAGIAPRTLAARVVQDADRLDALGAVGIARTLMLGGAMRRPLYDPVDPFCERRAPDDAISTIDHFYTKLLHLPARMQTATGRAEGERRATLLTHYLDALRLELADA
jgi:uncharacterized protein